MTNACLGFVNALTVASSMIDAGAIEYALVVAGEDPSPWHEAAIARLSEDDITREQVVQEPATSPYRAAAAVVGPADRHPDGHRIVGSVTRAGTEFSRLCVGGDGCLRTPPGLLNHGVGTRVEAWLDASATAGTGGTWIST